MSLKNRAVINAPRIAKTRRITRSNTQITSVYLVVGTSLLLRLHVLALIMWFTSSRVIHEMKVIQRKDPRIGKINVQKIAGTCGVQKIQKN